MSELPWNNARSVGLNSEASKGRHIAPKGASVSFSLPMPPSINEALINRTGAKSGRGRALTSKVRDWKAEARVDIRLQNPGKVPGYIIVVTNLQRPSKLADTDNRMKLLLDLLGQEDVIEDDRFISAVAHAWAPQFSNRLHISIIPSGPLALAFHPSDETGAVGAWAIPAPQHKYKAA